ncbi:cation-transporting P-type ATPase [Variovorax sp. YR216]|uniref:cation-transporting P-type ATPase n=1 Tax=Variovorax sp. YR216 TaxID=1882828 RepID=UPI000B821F1E|nr:cation-transporting P-type ATPase [Variovorax sp. YR216]
METGTLADTESEGLTEAEAKSRLRADRPNVLPSAGRRGLLRIAFRALTQPMFLLLLCTAGVFARLGSVVDAAALSASVVAVGALLIYQEQRTERNSNASGNRLADGSP